MTPDHITHLTPNQLAESAFNPRRTFSESGLQELATDIAAQGILQPITVRPLLGHLTEEYEIVFGHRRYRAALIAQLERIPCIVRAFTDEEAKRAQISENLSREDVHPIEEGEGFRALIRDHGLTAEQIMEQTGKSKSYVYGRIKIAEALHPDARQACLNGKIGAEVALLLARLRSHKLQAKALKAIDGKFLQLGDGGKKSFRNIQALLKEEFTLARKGAMFDTADALLCPEAGACTTCPKLAGNAPEYADLLEKSVGHHYTRATRADDCTDPECWAAKTAAHLKADADHLAAQGKRVVTGSAARAAIDARGQVKGAYVPLASVRAEIKKAKATVQTVVIQDPRTGKTVEAVKAADLVRAGLAKAAKEAAKPSRPAEDRYAKERAKKQAAADAQTEQNWALLRRVRAAIAAGPRRVEDLREIALVMVDAYGGSDQIPRLYDEEAKHQQSNYEVSRKQREALDASVPLEPDSNALALFCLDMILVSCVEGNPYDLDRKPYPLLRLAAAYGVPTEPLPTPSTAARAPAGAQEGQAPGRENKAAPAPKGRKGKAQAQPNAAAGAAQEQSDEAGSAGGEQTDEPADAGEVLEGSAWKFPGEPWEIAERKRAEAAAS